MQHVFRYNTSNDSVLFYRFENQGRHTVHIHMLACFRKIGNINIDYIRVTIPKDNTFLAYLVRFIFIL